MNYLFILGRNLKLSIAEIFSYFEKEKICIKSYCQKKNALLVDVDSEIEPSKCISRLGGTIAIGKVLYSGMLGEIIEKINKEEIYFGEKIKFSYSILNFADENSIEKVYSKIKNKFSKEKLKARYKAVKGIIKMQDNSVFGGTPSKLGSTGVVYFLFKNKKYHFGLIQGIYNAKETEKRDMGKPVRREALAISPRLSKILINLSQVKEQEILLDPFCGIGVILQEALLQNIKVIGVDIDKEAINKAKKNLDWLIKNYGIKSRHILINEDSIKVKPGKVDGIATEPSLGILLKKTPNEKQAVLMIKTFENLMIKVLNNLKRFIKQGGKIAFTSPLINIGRKRLGCNIEKICKNTGLKIYKLNSLDFPIKEHREGKIIGREIFVLTKI